MRLSRVAGIVVGVLVLAACAVGQEFWERKDFTQWSKDDCRRLLQDSPWAIRHDIVTTIVSPAGYAASDGNANEQINYTFQLRSALPVRQALVRSAQIANKYDKMTPEQKKAFDAQGNEFLALDTTDLVFVHVMYSSNVAATARTLAQFWQSQTLETLKDAVHLITPKGERIAPIRYQVAKGADLEFALVFPRAVNGEPLLGQGQKSLGLELVLSKTASQTTNLAAPVRRGSSGDVAQSFTGERIFVEFKVAKMMYKGQLLY